MKKVLFFIATGYIVFFLVYLLPAFAYNGAFFIIKYHANEREQIIIMDVYKSVKLATRISLWSLIGVYALFAVAIFCPRKKEPQNI